MNIRKLFFSCLIFVVIFLTAGCAPNNKLKEAKKYQKEGNYVPAILLLDKYMERNKHSAEVTLAELQRSECYYQLGLRAYSKKNWLLARRLFYLANSDEADELADDVLWELSKLAEANGNANLEMDYYNQVIEYIKTSELVPAMLLKRLQIFLSRNQYVSAYQDYKLLWDEYGASAEADSATILIDPHLPWFLESPERMREDGHYEAALAEFQIYANYPSSLQAEIYETMGMVYLEWAQRDREKGQYHALLEHIKKANEFAPALAKETKKLIKEICSGFIEEGDQFLIEGEIDKALLSYEKCFMLDAAWPEAIEKIDSANEQKQRFMEADSLYAKAEKAENLKEYQKAEELYKKSYELSGRKQVNKKKNEMANYIRAQESPKNFALEIIRDYKNGLISANVNGKIEKMLSQYGDQVSINDWKAIYSYGEFNFEVRIDIFSPEESYYYGWRVNLIERTIFPLNKESEAVMVK